MLIHAAVITSPGWGLPSLDPLPEPAGLQAFLAARPKTPVKPAPADPVAPPVPAPARRANHVPVQPSAATTGTSDARVPVVPAPREQVSAEAPPKAAVPVSAEPPASPAPPQAVAIDLPAKGRIRFSVTQGDQGFVIGQAVHEWRQDGFTYILRNVVETTGLASLFKPARVVQVSEGTVTAAGLRPGEFRRERDARIDYARLDWEAARISFADGGVREAPLPAGTQDLLSMIYQLALSAPGQGTVEMPIATTGKLDRYRFEILGEETLALRMGEVRVLHLKARSGVEATDVWIALAPPRLPVKIRYVDRKGEAFEQLAEEIDPPLAGEKGRP